MIGEVTECKAQGGTDSGWFVRVCWGSVSEACRHELVMGEVTMQAGQGDGGRARGSLALGHWCWASGSRLVSR